MNTKKPFLTKFIMKAIAIFMLFSWIGTSAHAQSLAPASQDELIAAINQDFSEAPKIAQLTIDDDYAFGHLVVIQDGELQEGEGKSFVAHIVNGAWQVSYSGSPEFAAVGQQISLQKTASSVRDFFENLGEQITVVEKSPQLQAIGGYKLPWECGKTQYVRQDWDSHPQVSTGVAIDVDMNLRTPITAARGGVVYRVKENETACGCDASLYSKGNYIMILNDMGYYDTYYHIAQGGAIPEEGDTVFQGQRIAYSYKTGMSCGSRSICDSGTCSVSDCQVYDHLHFQVFQSPWVGQGLRVSFDDVAGGDVYKGYYTSGNCGIVPPPPVKEIVLETPSITPPFGPICSTYWMQLTNTRGYPYYLSLNVNDPANSSNGSTWSPNLPAYGKYRVEAYISSHSSLSWKCPTKTITGDTRDARYWITTKDGTLSNYIKGDQLPLNDTWMSLGEYWFNAGQAETVKLTDLNGEDNLTRSIQFGAMKFSLLTPEGQPSNVSVTNSASGSGVQVTWNAVNGATYYVVLRSDGASAESTTTTWLDSSTVDALKYSYTVQACNYYGCSGPNDFGLGSFHVYLPLINK